MQFQSGYRTVIPMRPLGVGDTLDAVFRLLKFNPAAYFVFPMIISMAVALISALLTIAFGEVSTESIIGSAAGVSASIAGPDTFIQLLLNVLSTIAIAVVGTRITIATVRGHKVSLKESFSYIKPQFGRISLRLLGYYLLITAAIIVIILVLALIVGLTAGLGFFSIFSSTTTIDDPSLAAGLGAMIGFLLLLLILGVAVALFYLRFALAPSAIVVEDIGPIKAIGRSWNLTKGSFGYLLGTVLVMTILIAMASSLLGGIVALISGLIFVGNSAAATASILVGAMGGALVLSLVVTPFESALINLLYVNMRFKRENFHLQLIDACKPIS